MATPAEKLADALTRMNAVQVDGIVRASNLTRTTQERLVKAGFLQEILRGWYFVTGPATALGSTAWYGQYWNFLRQYLSQRFGNNYCLLPEPSLRLLTGSTVVPRQLSIMRRSPGQQVLNLPLSTSLYIYQDRKNIPDRVTEVEGIRVMELTDALMRVSEAFFRASSEDAVLALRLIRDPAPLLRDLLDNGRSAVAGRLAGAFRHVGDTKTAERILSTMKSAGYDVREHNPFSAPAPEAQLTRPVSPYVGRLQGMWASLRESVVQVFPEAPGNTADAASYLARMEEKYPEDAYHSLSIEGYRVTPELIERIRQGDWNPEERSSDRESRDALAAKGYLDAFAAVKESVRRILTGKPAAEVVREAHHDWYQALFAPSVQAGLFSAGALAGYRNSAVYIRGSRHVPLPAHAITDAMEAFFDLLAAETNPAVQAVLGHFLFVFIHPYSDGNGRMARFLMNAFFAAGGFPWTIIHLSSRDRYMSALEEASVNRDMVPFARCVREEMQNAE